MYTTNAFTYALASASRSSGMIIARQTDRQTDRLITYKRLAAASKIMLGLILMMVFGSPGVRAQSFTYTPNNEYGKVVIGTTPQMNQYIVADGAQFSSNDPTINLSMDCLAANGYGQFTSSSSIGSLGSVTSTDHPWTFSPDQIGGRTWDMSISGVRKGWFLLGNLIGMPSEGVDISIPGPTTTHPGCQPPGIVSGGKFILIDPANGCQVDANLVGSVRYLQVDIARTSFFVEGLNDDRAPTSPEQQINISLISANPIPPQMVNLPIFSYPSISTVSGGISHAVDNSDPSGDPRDESHFCMDQSFLYVTWVSQHTFMGTHFREIWAAAVDIFTGAVVTAPFQIITDNIHNYTRPTIACDRRGAPTTPTFTVAFITDLTTASVGSYIGNVAQFGGIEPFIKNYFDPFTAKPSTTFDAYTSATHARVLVSSVAGSMAPAVIAVYVITNDDLLLYAPTWTSANDHANYVDGQQANTGHHYPSPISTLGGSSVSGIKDRFIVAFANPYDNQTGDYNQFHCLYQLQVTSTENPLILVRGNDGFCVYHIGGDTRVLLNRNAGVVIDDPTSYCGAVNQMGIHVHWRTASNVHFYVRDARSFDEPIEENTLMTNVCYIADGSSHGGTTGATTVGFNRKVTMWTDPNYGLDNSNSSSGLYFLSNYFSTSLTGLNSLNNIGTLMFSADNNISLGFTGQTFELPDGSGPGNFFTAPNSNITYNTSASGQNIIINDGSTWDFFGTADIFAGNRVPSCFSNPSNGGVTLIGMVVFSGDTVRAVLNIHPGGQFFGVPINTFLSDIEIQDGANIFPLKTSGSPNGNATGVLELNLDGNFIFSSQVNSHLPYSTWVDESTATFPGWRLENAVVQMDEFGTDDNTTFFVHSNHTSYTNSVSSGDPGIASVSYNGGCSSDYSIGFDMNKVVFENGSFNRMRFVGWGPGNGGLEVTNNTIDDMDGNAIDIMRNTDTGNCDYADIAVSNNTFLHIMNHGTSGTHYDPLFGIVIEGFNNSSFFGQLNVNDNIFTTTVNDGNPDDNLGKSAIEFINSTGNIDNNAVTDFQFGSGITLTTDASLSTSLAYLCGNDLENLFYGILSDHFHGYVNFCKILDCTFGYSSGVSDQPRIVFTKIGSISTTTPGTSIDIDIVGSGASTFYAEVDLTGVHGGGNDYSAKNSLLLTSTANIDLEDQYELVDIGHLVSTWVHFGENNFVGTSTDPGMIFDLGGPVSIGNIDNNFWGQGGAGFTPWPPTTGLFLGITLPAVGTFLTTQSTFSVSCAPFTSIVRDSNGNKPLAEHQILSYDTCAYLFQWKYDQPQSSEEAKEQYDTLRMYIERCAANDDQSYRAFNSLDGAVQLYSDDSARFETYRSWLISVIYLNTTEPAYFCNCLGSIAGTYQYGQFRVRAGLALINYLRHISSCYGTGLDKEFTKDSLYAIEYGYDPTHLPPLDSLGLGFLLKGKVNQTPSGSLPSRYLASFSSNPNPFTSETKLNFALNRMTYTTIAVYDVLGRLVWGDGRGSSLEAGEHTIKLDATNFPSGTLYARISTGFGEVKTVKLVHEK